MYFGKAPKQGQIYGQVYTIRADGPLKLNLCSILIGTLKGTLRPKSPGSGSPKVRQTC